MLKNLFSFFAREKFYRGLLFFLAVVYGIAWFVMPRESKHPKPSAAVQGVYEAAEDRFEKEMTAAGSAEAYWRKHPEVKTFFLLSASLFALLFLAGMVIDFPLLFDPDFRARIACPVPSSGMEWGGGLLIKWGLLFFSGALALSFFFEAAGYFLNFHLQDNFYLLLHATLVDFLGAGLIFYLIRRAKGGLRDVGLWIPQGRFIRECLFGLGAYLAVIPFFLATTLVVVILTQIFSYKPPVHPLVDVFLAEERRSPALVFYSVFLATCLGPFLEEIFFRGFCYPIFKKKFGMAAAMVLSASLFAFIHENTFAFWPIFVLGLALAYVVEKRKSLVAPVVLHVVHNSIFITYFFYAKDMVLQKGGL